MNLDELRSAQAKERRKDSLQHLRDSFYDDVGAYVADLRAARDRRAEQVENPFADDDVRRLSDEVETAEEVAEALYERRVGKVVKLASFAAADMPVEEEGMTTEERELFDDLVERITENKSQVLDVLAGESMADGPPIGSASEGSAAAAAPGESGAGETGAGEPEAAVDEVEPAVGGAEPTDASARTGSADAPAADAPPTDASGPSASERVETGDGGAPGAPGDGGALAGAMGGDGGDPDGESRRAGGRDAAAVPSDGDEESAPAAGDDASDGEAPTPVPPEPAPPGAVGVDDGDESGDGTRERPVDEADDRAESGATTDGGPRAAAGDRAAEPAADGPDAGATEPTGSAGAESVDAERATVRITRDVGAIFGVDEREYDLASEDVVSLPVENADPLVRRDAAERID